MRSKRIIIMVILALKSFALLGQNISGIVNAYYPVSNIAGNVVTVGTGTGATHTLAAGDHVVLIQMTGIPPVQTGSNMGKYELRKVASVSGSNITLDGIVNTYSVSTEKVQLVFAPYSSAFTVTANVTAKVWDGTTGGVIALKGTNLTLNANIDATATGFSQANPPTTTITTSLSSGQGSTDGRGFDAGNGGGVGGGGIGGGGGNGGLFIHLGGSGGSVGSGGLGSELVLGRIGTDGAGVNGGEPARHSTYQTGSGGGGGGGIIGGGGGGGGSFPAGSINPPYQTGGGGGGVTGGGGGGGGGYSISGGEGGGGIKGVGNGSNNGCSDGCSGAGGGSYGGGGGAASSFSGGDDSHGGGGGGSWTGGGISGKGGTLYPQNAGAGNSSVSVIITDSDHYLNNNQPRIIMGGAGGNSYCQTEGFGGGIIILEFNNTIGNNFKIISNGESKGLTPNCPEATREAGGGAGGAGGGAGGQMILNIKNFTSTTNIEAKGGKGGDGNNDDVYHGGTGGAGGGGGGIWIYGSTASSNTGSQTVNVANTNLTGAGSTAGVAGGSAGADTNNPKNGYRTGTGGAGGNGLIIQSPNAPAWQSSSCSITLTANAGTCNTSSNQYMLTGNLTIANAPTTGSLTIMVSGGGSVSYPVSSLPANYSISGLNADGVSHTVTATFSDDNTCTNTATFTAPIACGTNPCPNTTYNLCPGDNYTLTADAGLTNYQWYTISGADTLPILGANNQTFIVNSIGTYIWTAQQSNGCTIKLCCPGVFVSNNCPTCSITITANAGTCNTSSNQYTLTGNLTITNAPTTGSLTIMVSGGGSVSYPVSSLPATYSITGLNADGVSHTVTVTFSDDTSCTNTATYIAPIACGSNPCPNPNCGPVTVQKN